MKLTLLEKKVNLIDYYKSKGINIDVNMINSKTEKEIEFLYKQMVLSKKVNRR